MSWYPIGHGDKKLLEEDIFKKLGNKYNKTSVQIILRWHIQMGFIVITGSKNIEHIKENLDILDFESTKEEMNEISKINKNIRYYNRTDEQLDNFAKWKPKYEVK